MDTGVAEAVTTALSTFKTDALAQIAGVLPVALPVTITVGLAFMGIRLFRGIAHV
jgi:type IV secretory pathway VirB6-like protein